MNERQLELLRSIGAAAGSVTSADSGLVTTVYALRNRGLVTTPRSPGGWRAEVTEAGRFYLHHGHHPDRPLPASKVRAAEAEKSSVPVITPAELMERVRAAGGDLKIENPAPAERAAWRRVIYAARRNELPGAGGLMYLGRDSGNLHIILPHLKYAPPAGAVAGAVVPRPVIVPVEVPRRLPASPHPAAAAVRDDPGMVSVASVLVPRVLRILQAIGVEAARRGYELTVDSRDGRGSLVVMASEFRYVLVIREEYERPPRPRQTDEEKAGPWRARRIADPVPTGRLQLSVGKEGRTWADRTR